MDSLIVMLDDQVTDQATKRMLQNVIDRKRKFDFLKKKHFRTTLITIILALVYVGYVYILYVKPYSYSFFDMFFAFISNSSAFFYCIVIFGIYGYMLILKKKMDKAEREYHALRCEIVDRSKDLWKKESAWKERHKVFSMLKENYDINLYHENK